jgi:hypothetical protein
MNPLLKGEDGDAAQPQAGEENKADLFNPSFLELSQVIVAV